MTVRSGQLRERITFSARGDGDDGYGGVIVGAGPWEAKGTVAGHIHYLRGGETVMADRLQGTNTAIITVRSSTLTRSATSAWKITDGDGKDWNIRAISDPTGRRAWLEILAEAGVPD